MELEDDAFSIFSGIICHSSVTDLDQIDQIDLILKGDTMSSRLVQEELKKNYLSEIVKIKVPD